MPYTSCDECGESTYYPYEERPKEIAVPPVPSDKDTLYALKSKIYNKMFTIYEQLSKVYELHPEDNIDRRNQVINFTNQINVLKYVVGELPT